MDWLHHPATGQFRLIWKLLIYLALGVGGMFLLLFILAGLIDARPDIAFPVFMLAFAVWHLFATWYCVRLLERRPIAAVGIGWDRPWLRHLALGTLSGAAAIGACCALWLAAGWAQADRPVYDWALAGQIGLFLLSMIGVAVWEELSYRGYPFQIMSRWNRAVAVIVLGAAFTSTHIWKPGGSEPIAVFNLMLAHVIFVVLYWRTRSLWLPIGAHLGWNFAQGAVLGLRVSGSRPVPSLIDVQVQSNLWTGGQFGPESSLTATLIGLVLLVVLWRWLPQRTPRPDLLTEEPPSIRPAEDAPVATGE
jgi:membrane protease YdiL (CAAX protease family)